MAGLKDAFSKGITTINVKTDNFMELTKSKTHINTLQTECGSLYGKIGAAVYQQWKDKGEVSAAAVEPLLQQVKQHMNEIEQEKVKMENLQKMEAEILGKKNNNSRTAPAAPPTGAAKQIFCSQCGAANNLVNKFCCSCGNPLVR